MSQHFTNLAILPSKEYDSSYQTLDIESALATGVSLVTTNKQQFIYIHAEIQNIGKKKKDKQNPIFLLEIQKNPLTGSPYFFLGIIGAEGLMSSQMRSFKKSMKDFSQQDIYSLICKIEDMDVCSVSNIALAICDIIEAKK